MPVAASRSRVAAQLRAWLMVTVGTAYGASVEVSRPICEPFEQRPPRLFHFTFGRGRGLITCLLLTSQDRVNVPGLFPGVRVLGASVPDRRCVRGQPPRRIRLRRLGGPVRPIRFCPSGGRRLPIGAPGRRRGPGRSCASRPSAMPWAGTSRHVSWTSTRTADGAVDLQTLTSTGDRPWRWALAVNSASTNQTFSAQSRSSRYNAARTHCRSSCDGIRDGRSTHNTSRARSPPRPSSWALDPTRSTAPMASTYPRTPMFTPTPWARVAAVVIRFVTAGIRCRICAL